jgi:endonuclease/exonuclease/phosphatase (EEP) superfamily protein YafD
MRFIKFFTENFNSEKPLVFMGSAGQAMLDKKITILVWNVYKSRKTGWYSDFFKLIQNVDLILLQESVLKNDANDFFKENNQLEWIMASSHQYYISQIITGLKTGCVAKASSPIFFQSPDKEPILQTAKLLLATKYSLTNSLKQLLVVNVHAINFVSLKKYTRHIHQILSVVQQHSGPVILAGDFNCWSAARHNLLFSVVKKEGLTAVTLERRPRWIHFNRHLDFIFYRELELVKADALCHIKSSDHYPLLAEFQVLHSKVR